MGVVVVVVVAAVAGNGKAMTAENIKPVPPPPPVENISGVYCQQRHNKPRRIVVCRENDNAK